MATLASYGVPKVHGDTSPFQSPSTSTPTREAINVPKKSVPLSTSFSISLDNSSESMFPPRRPMSPTLGSAAAAMKKFLRRRRTTCEGDSPHQQHHYPSMLQTFVLVGGVGAESGTTIYDTDHIPSSLPSSPYSSIPLPMASMTKSQSHMATPPTSPINNISTMMRNDRGRDTRRGAYSVSRHLSSENNSRVEHNLVVGHKGVVDSTPKDMKKLKRSLSADSLAPFQARTSSLHRNHRRSTLGLDSAMEMLNVESLDQSMVKASSWDDDMDDEGCMSADVSFSSLLATDLEMLDSLKNEHRQGGKRTVAKEKKQHQSPPQINSRRQKSSIYQASMEFLASYHGPAHLGQGEFSARYLKKEQAKRPDRFLERSIPDPPSKTDMCTRSRLASVASNSTALLLQTDDEGILLISTTPTPTQFYSALKTRKALRTLVTDNEQEFENMLERGFLWSPVSELLDPYSQDDDDDDDDPLEDQDLMLPTVPPQYFLTLRITLTPWHARADESEIYGHFGSRQAPIPTITRKMSAYSLTSNVSPSLSPAASTTSLSLDSSISRDSSPSPSTPFPRDGSPESECPFKKAIKSALILERSSSLLRSKKQKVDRSPHASPKLTGRTLKTSHPSSCVPCHPLDMPVHPFDQESSRHPREESLPGTISNTSTLLSPTLLSPSQSRDQSLPPRKGSLSPLSLPLPNAQGNIGELISPPEKSKDRMRDHTRTTSPPTVPTRRKGSTPAIFYSPPGCNSSEPLIEQGSPTRPQSAAPRSLSMSGTPRPKRTDYVVPSLRAAARQPSSIPVRKRSDQSDVLNANLAAYRMNEERTSTRPQKQACRQKNSGNPQLAARGSPEEHQRVGELNDHLSSTGQQRLHSRDRQAASYASALPVLKSRKQAFYETSEGPNHMDHRGASNYSLVSSTSPPLSRPRHFWSSKEKNLGSDPLVTDILDYHMSEFDSHRAQDPRHTNEYHGKTPFTVSGVEIIPRSVHRHIVKVDRGFVITDNSHNNSSSQDERGDEMTDVTASSGLEAMSEKAVAAQDDGCWRPVQLCQTPAMQTFAFP
ncbi:hypothetical protein CPC16_000456 [Podila verticillata]|nr:hypothetical protein CPC16_000456 [Podila verticillata]